MATQFYARDVAEASRPTRRTLFTADLASDAVGLFPYLSPDEIAGLAPMVHRHYQARGRELIGTRSSRIPTYREPVACPIPPRAWSVEEGPTGWSISLLLGRGAWVLRLATQGKRAQSSLRQIVSGDVAKGPVSVYEDGGASSGASSGKRRTRVMVRITCLALPWPHEVLESQVPAIQKDGIGPLPEVTGPFHRFSGSGMFVRI